MTRGQRDEALIEESHEWWDDLRHEDETRYPKWKIDLFRHRDRTQDPRPTRAPGA